MLMKFGIFEQENPIGPTAGITLHFHQVSGKAVSFLKQRKSWPLKHIKIVLLDFSRAYDAGNRGDRHTG